MQSAIEQIQKQWGRWMNSVATQTDHYRRDFDGCPILWEGSLDGTEKRWRILYIDSDQVFGVHLPSYQRPGEFAAGQLWQRGWVERGLFDVDKMIRRAKKGKLPVFKLKRAKHGQQEAEAKKSQEAEAQLETVMAWCRRGVRGKSDARKPVENARTRDTLRSRARSVVSVPKGTFTLRERNRQPEVAHGTLRSRSEKQDNRPRKKEHETFVLRSRRR
jgi:hypothetical protein